MTKAEAETKAEAKILGKLVLVGNSKSETSGLPPNYYLASTNKLSFHPKIKH